MSKTRTEILKKLLFEIAEISKEHNLKYTLTGEFAKLVDEEGRMPEEFNNVSIAMTMGDIERLIKIVNNGSSSYRQVEYILNNYYSMVSSVRYYNSDTTLINLNEFENHTNHGIFIKIIPIVKITRGKKAKLLKLMQNIWAYSLKRVNAYPYREIVPIIMSKLMIGLVGRERGAKRLYKYNNKLKYIDKWEDIFTHDKFRIGQAQFDSSLNWHLNSRNCQGHELLLAECILDKKIENVGLMTANKNSIVSTEISFQDAFDQYNINRRMKKIQKLRDKYLRIARKSKDASSYINSAWNVYLMTHDVISLKKHYDSEVCLKIKDAWSKKDYKSYQREMRPYLEAKIYWEQKQIPFFKISELEKLALLGENAD